MKHKPKLVAIQREWRFYQIYLNLSVTVMVFLWLNFQWKMVEDPIKIKTSTQFCLICPIAINYGLFSWIHSQASQSILKELMNSLLLRKPCLYSSIRLSIFLEHWKLSGFDSFQLCWLETVLCMLISLRTTLNSPKTISIFRKIYHVISDSQMNCELLFTEHKVLWYEHFIIEQFVYISHKS